MRARSLIVRLIIAVLAVVTAFAPGGASILDARAAANDVNERAFTHFEAPGSPHAIAHQENCALCSVASHLPAEAPTPPALVVTRAAAWPARDAWMAHHAANPVGALRSRAPPA